MAPKVPGTTPAATPWPTGGRISAGAETAFDHAGQLDGLFPLVGMSECTVRNKTQRFGELQAEPEEQWIRESQDTEDYPQRDPAAGDASGLLLRSGPWERYSKPS